MKVVILTAGMGKRFRRLDLPKPLTLLKTGQTILGRQIEILSQFVSPHQILLVVGYRKDKIIDTYPNLQYVYNPYYEDQNTAKSLLRATEKISDQDLLWLNGDVVFHPDVIEKLLESKYQNKMVVNQGIVGDEEVKYRVNSRGQILEVSKEIGHSKGEALGINFFKKKHLAEFRHQLALCEENDYFEKAIEKCIEQRMTVWSVTVEANHCVEVDFPEDLDKANQLIDSW